MREQRVAILNCVHLDEIWHSQGFFPSLILLAFSTSLFSRSSASSRRLRALCLSKSAAFRGELLAPAPDMSYEPRLTIGILSMELRLFERSESTLWNKNFCL